MLVPVADETRWLDRTQGEAWRDLLTVLTSVLPEIERRFDEYGIRHVDYAILAKLSDASDHTRRLSDLAADAHITRSRLSHRLRHLTSVGLVARVQDDDDRRGGNAILTAKGLKTLEAIAPDHALDVLEHIFDHMTSRETTAFARALARVTQQHNPG